MNEKEKIVKHVTVNERLLHQLYEDIAKERQAKKELVEALEKIIPDANELYKAAKERGEEFDNLIRGNSSFCNGVNYMNAKIIEFINKHKEKE